MASLAGSKSVRKRLGHPRYQKVDKPENLIEVPERYASDEEAEADLRRLISEAQAKGERSCPNCGKVDCFLHCDLSRSTSTKETATDTILRFWWFIDNFPSPPEVYSESETDFRSLAEMVGMDTNTYFALLDEQEKA